MENQDRKRELIIEAALKRFAHFGLAKTTMTEIASDLSLSKALLYYYFPDKLNLYAGVLESLVNLVADDIEKGMATIADAQTALEFYIERRHFYIKQYYNILDFIRTSGPDLPEQVYSVLEKAKTLEIEQISNAIRKKPVSQSESEEAASLLIDAFYGMRMTVFNSKKKFQIDNAEFDMVLQRQKKLGKIFLNGLE